MLFLVAYPCAVFLDVLKDVNQSYFRSPTGSSNLCSCFRCKNSDRVADECCHGDECDLLRWLHAAFQALSIKCVTYDQQSSCNPVFGFDVDADVVIDHNKQLNCWEVYGYGKYAGIKALRKLTTMEQLSDFELGFERLKKKIRSLLMVMRGTYEKGILFSRERDDKGRLGFIIDPPGEWSMHMRVYICRDAAPPPPPRARMDPSYVPMSSESPDASLQMTTPSPPPPTRTPLTRAPTPTARRIKKRPEQVVPSSPPLEGTASNASSAPRPLDLHRGLDRELEQLRSDHAVLRAAFSDLRSRLSDLECSSQRVASAFARMAELHGLVQGRSMRQHPARADRPASAPSFHPSHHPSGHTHHPPIHHRAHPRSPRDSPSPRGGFGGSFCRGAAPPRGASLHQRAGDRRDRLQ